ncbi:MAG: hypothetical protein H0X62_11030 [Bacteroidetes bacterium]|nr:hypothetical protein [Bacteroidota bacterium]
MFSLFNFIITQPIWAVVSTILLWKLTFIILKKINFSETNWKRLDYIWIFIALMALLAIINENNAISEEYELKNTKQEIIFDISLLNFLLSDKQTCYKYKNSIDAPDDFIQRQYDQDQICAWSKDFRIETDSVAGIPICAIDTFSLKTIEFKTDFMDNYVREFSVYTYRINRNIEKYNNCAIEVNSKVWDEFYKTVGVFLLILAIAIRLALTENNVSMTKQAKGAGRNEE